MQEERADISDPLIQDNQDKSQESKEDSEDSEESSAKNSEDSTQEGLKEGGAYKDTTHTDVTKENNISTPNYENGNLPHHLQGGAKIRNPYLKTKKITEQGILHAIPQQLTNMKKSTPSGSIDKQITLKNGMLRPHIQRYTLCIKIIKSKSEEEEQVLVQKTLTKVFQHCSRRRF